MQNSSNKSPPVSSPTAAPPTPSATQQHHPASPSALRCLQQSSPGTLDHSLSMHSSSGCSSLVVVSPTQAARLRTPTANDVIANISDRLQMLHSGGDAVSSDSRRRAPSSPQSSGTGSGTGSGSGSGAHVAVTRRASAAIAMERALPLALLHLPRRSVSTDPRSGRASFASPPRLSASSIRGKSGAAAAATGNRSSSTNPLMSRSDMSALSSSPYAAGIFKPSSSVFAQYRAKRIASNRGEYVRHRKIGAGAFGQTWIVEWRPATVKPKSSPARVNRRKSSVVPDAFERPDTLTGSAHTSGEGCCSFAQSKKPTSPGAGGGGGSGGAHAIVTGNGNLLTFMKNPSGQQQHEQHHGRHSVRGATPDSAGHGGGGAVSSAGSSSLFFAATAAAAAATTISSGTIPQTQIVRDSSSTVGTSVTVPAPNLHHSFSSFAPVAPMPPAPVSMLSCTRPVVNIITGHRIPFDRAFVLKVAVKTKKEQQQRAEEARQKKAFPASPGLIRRFAASATDLTAGVASPLVLTPQQNEDGHDSHAGFQSDDDEDEHQQVLTNALSKMQLRRQRQQESSFSSASSGSLSSLIMPDFIGVCRASSPLQGCVSAYLSGVTSPITGSLNETQRTGGVQTLQRRDVQAALKHHTTVFHEGSVLKNCAHPNIVGFVDEFEDETNRYLVMEYVDGGDLRNEVERRAQVEPRAEVSGLHLSVPSALFLWVQALSAVEYLHRHNIMHHDIKTANLLFSKKWRVLLADFGFARNYGHDIDERSAATAVRGTPHYSAPELFLRQAISGKVDIWALGVVLFELLALQRPFERGDNSPDEVAYRVVNEPPAHVNNTRPPHLQVPAEVIALIDMMLQKDPAQRPTAKQLMRMPVVGVALDEYRVSFRKAALHSPQPIDAVLVSMLEEHIKLVRSDDLSSPASRRMHSKMRREKLSGTTNLAKEEA